MPSVTTILGRFKSSDALIAWANREGLAGRDHTTARDSAAHLGTLVHTMCESHITGRTLSLDVSEVSEEDYDIARLCEANFAAWWKSVGGIQISSEQGMVSEMYRFGGTPDAIAHVNGELCVVDFKTSKAVYGDHIAQVAAYRTLWNEQLPAHGQYAGPGAWIVRLDKKTGLVVPKYFPDITPGWAAFKSLRSAYDEMAELEKLVRRKTK